MSQRGSHDGVMATITAYALLGKAHPAHGGLEETHLIRLSEDSRPCLHLYRIDRDRDGSLLGERIGKWVPTADHTLEDLLLMVAVLVEEDAELTAALKRGLPDGNIRTIHALSDAGDIRRNKLYAAMRARRWRKKLVLTVLRGSTIERQLDRLRMLSLKCEVCVSRGTGETAEDGQEASTGS